MDKDNDFINQEGTIVKVADINREMRKSFIDYSMSVIVSRALPDVRDGLKPVHRRIIYTMHEAGLTPDKPFKKCATTVGDVLGHYHPHGDASVYDALVRLAQSFSMRYPLVEGHGNFGSIDGDPPAAYRYTESRMSKMAQYMVMDIGKDTIDFDSNFDDSRKEPVVLPSRYPNLLVNGSSGIAVGMATNIPPHNLGEVCDAIDALVDNPDIDLDGLMNFIKGPDFPTGGIIMGRSGIRSAYATGRGKLTVRAKAEIEEDSKGRSSIVVTEIPYMVNKTRIIEGIAELVKDKRIDGISYIRDESDRDGMRIVFEVKRDASPQIVLNQLYHYSLLQDTFGVIMLALVDGQPKVLTLKEMLQKYIDFQGRSSPAGPNTTSSGPPTVPISSRGSNGRSISSTRSSPPSAPARAAYRKQRPPSWKNSGLTTPRRAPLSLTGWGSWPGWKSSKSRRNWPSWRRKSTNTRTYSATTPKSWRSLRRSSPKSAPNSPTPAAPRSGRSKGTSISRI